MKKIYYTDKECEEMLRTLGELTEELHSINNPELKDKITSLMEHFDVIHREGLSRLWTILKKKHPETCEQLNKDYTIHNLLTLYDLEIFEGIENAVDPVTFIPDDEVKMLS
ncbi:MAG: hypothetical protein RJQ09_07910 [Cyclobacteriaceae bacterium]